MDSNYYYLNINTLKIKGSCSTVIDMKPLLYDIPLIYSNTILFNLDLLQLSNYQHSKWKELRT